MPSPIVPDDELRRLYAAGVKQKDIKEYYGLARAENLRVQERKLGLGPRRVGVSQHLTPSVAEVLGAPKKGNTYIPAPTEVRRNIVKAMRPGQWYKAREIADLIDTPYTRVRTSLPVLARMGIVVSKTEGNPKHGRLYRLNLKVSE